MYEYNASIINVVDGDTFDLDVDLGFKIHHMIRVRLLDIDTPEKRGEKEKDLGLICTEYAKQFVGKDVIIQSYKDKDLNTDSFGRWLVYLKFKDTGIDIYHLYNALGINKKDSGYSEDKVRALIRSINYNI